jgi:hypothetical protein
VRATGAWIAVMMVALAMGARGSRGGDPVAADALWDWAEREGAGDLTHPVYLDAARELSRVRPWQPGYAHARGRLERIEVARRGQLTSGAGRSEAGQEGGT